MAHMTYLASPFTSNSAITQYERSRAAHIAAAKMLDIGMFCIPAIPLGMSFQKYMENPDCSWAAWKEYDEELIRRCDSITVLCIDGWKESVGVQAEIAFAKSLGREVRFAFFNKGGVLEISHLEGPSDMHSVPPIRRSK